MEVVLETPRLVLRAFRGEDLDAYAAMSAERSTRRLRLSVTASPVG